MLQREKGVPPQLPLKHTCLPCRYYSFYAMCQDEINARERGDGGGEERGGETPFISCASNPACMESRLYADAEEEEEMLPTSLGT